MNNLWRKSFMAGILSVSLTAGAVTPAFASAAPDGKTDAASLAGGMGISRNWESWKAEWEAVKNDWTQVSLTPGSDFSQLNFAWYSKKDNSDTAEKKEEQAAQEFSAQSGDAFSDSSESVFAGTEADTSAARSFNGRSFRLIFRIPKHAEMSIISSTAPTTMSGIAA